MAELISVITPVYNSEKYIADTIESVLAQTYPDWELIIVDDCSTDNSKDIIREFAKNENRIHLIEFEENAGTGKARDVALKNAKGRFVAFLDSDDMWLPEKLEKQIRFMTENNYPISFTSYKLIDENGKDLERVIQVVNSVNLHQYLKNTIIGYSSSMIDLKQTGSFQIADIRIRVDTQVWISLLKKGFIAYGLDEVLMIYRVHKNSISSNKFYAAKKTWNLFYNVEKLGLFKSAYYFSNYAFNAFKKHYL